jgi:hypothetical protein
VNLELKFPTPMPTTFDILPDRIEGALSHTGRAYPCVVCGNVTPWRINFQDVPSIPVCSDECVDVFQSAKVNEFD